MSTNELDDFPKRNKIPLVDTHYKPKEQDMDDWYEKGELPPTPEGHDGSGIRNHTINAYVEVGEC